MNQFALLRRNRAFSRFWLSQVTGLMGASLMTVVASLAVLEHGGDASSVAAILAARAIGLFLGYLVLGGLSVHLEPRNLMIWADLLRVLTTLLVAVGISTGCFPVAVAAVLVTGLAEAVFSPSARALLIAIVASDDLASANSLSSLARSSTMIAGPALAALLLLIVAPVWGILLNCAAFGMSALFLGRLLYVGGTDKRPALTPRTYARSLREGAAALLCTSWLWRYATAGALQTVLAVGAWTVLGPVLVRDAWGASAFGAVLGAFAIGGLIGALSAPVLARGRAAVRASLFVALFGVALLGVAQERLAICLLGCCIGGASLELGKVLFDTVLQTNIPAELLGRTSALLMLPSTFLLPLSYLVVGGLSERIGPAPVIRAAAVSAAMCMVVFAMQRTTRLMEVKDESASAPS